MKRSSFPTRRDRRLHERTDTTVTAWDHFFAQYQAEGRQRLDGYDASHFEALTDAELTRARAMILERAEAGETPEIRALPLLGVPEALRVVERLLAREQAPTPTRLTACEAGWTLTQAPGYQHEIITIADTGDDFVRSQAITILAMIPLTPSALAEVTARLRVEANDTLSVQLAKAVLRGRGVALTSMAEFSRALPLVRALAAPNLHDRGEAIAHLDELIARHRGT
jgi:hypothetical protein